MEIDLKQPSLPFYLWICLLALVLFPSLTGAQTTAAGEWTWVGGNNAFGGPCANGIPCESGQTLGNVGVYGTLGVPAAGNIPGSRSGSSTWVDSAGNLWLFGGYGIDSANTLGQLNDLWKFTPSTNEWTWMSGSSTILSSCTPITGGYEYCGLLGVYGTLGVPAAENVPAGRSEASSWIDSSGNFWLFGGTDPGSELLNDLWEYFPSSNEWAWIGGAIPPANSCTANCVPPGVYDTLGTPNAANMPAGRYGASNWTDNNGNLWLFAGLGGDYEHTGLNDLMEFVPSANEWTWIGGSDPTSQSNTGTAGVYGTLGVYAPGNIPGSRVGASYWTDSGGNFWLLGGTVILPVSGEFSVQNDLWEFSPSMNMWAWMGGQNTPSNCTTVEGQEGCNGNPGVYGTLGVPAAGNIPGARSNASTWTDKSNHLWLFGGDGFNDLWVLEPAANEWAWMGGTNPETSSQSPQPGVYGTLGVPATGNVPGGRNEAATWTDRSGDFWLFGGNNAPNDLWVYKPPASAATPAFSVAAGTYTAIQDVTITDSTANAAVYYTTDGSAPTTSSTVYSSPIAVASTETLQAVAIATNVLTSAVASAAYTINVLPPDFSIAGSTGSIAVTAGGSGTATISVSPQGGFASAVTFGCSGLPAGASCTFSPASVTPPGTVSTSVTITTSAATAQERRNGFPVLPESALAIALCGFGMRKRRRLQVLLLLALSAAGLNLLSGCGGGSSGSSTAPPVTSTVTVTATSGALSHTITISLTVN